MLAEVARLELGARQPGVSRHHRLRHDGAGIDQVGDLPLVGIFAADPGQVGAGAFRSPLHRMVVLRLHGEREGAVALDLVTQRPDHLRMAGVAAFANVYIAAGQLERGVDPHRRIVLHRLVDREQRGDLDRAPYAGDDHDPDGEADCVTFKPIVGFEHHLLFRRLELTG